MTDPVIDPATHADLFAPCGDLAARLLPYAFEGNGDGAHDLSHLVRVWRNVVAIHAREGGDLRCLAAATLLHDCVSLPKNAPDRDRASRLAAARAEPLLAALGWSDTDIATTLHAIEAHSFSADISPETTEAAILRDADRLDALGLIGVARCFHVAGQMGSGLYDPADPGGLDRPLDDTRFAIDHFRTKLLHLATGFLTATGARMARQRHRRLQTFLNDFMAEITGDAPGNPTTGAIARPD